MSNAQSTEVRRRYIGIPQDLDAWIAELARKGQRHYSPQLVRLLRYAKRQYERRTEKKGALS